MKNFKRISAALLIWLMLICLSSVSVFATSTTQDGLEATLKTDRDSYSKSDRISASLIVKNSSSTDIENVVLETLVPDGYSRADNTQTLKAVDTLKTNETINLDAVYVPNSNGNNTSAKTTDSNTNNQVVNTSDVFGTIMILFLVICVCSVIITVMLKSKKSQKILSILLAVAIFGSMAIISMPFDTFAVETSEKMTKSFSLLQNIKVDSKDITIKAIVKYNIIQPNTPDDVGEIYFSPVDTEHICQIDDFISCADNEILIVTKDGITKEQVDILAKKYNTEIVGRIEISGDYQLKLKENATIEKLNELIDNIAKEDIIESSSLNYIQEYGDSDIVKQRNNFYYGKEWESDLQNFNDAQGKSWGLEAINTFGAWDLLNSHSEQVHPVKVGILDGGFDVRHEDLGFAAWFYEDGKNGTENIMDYDPKDLRVPVAVKVLNLLAEKEHGTHVAGIIGAKNDNDTGICGIYPYGNNNLYAVSSSNVTIYSENGYWPTSSMHQKVSFAELIIRNVKVINESLGFNYYIDKFSIKDENDKVIGTDYKALENWIKTNDFSEMEKEANISANFLDRMLKKGYDFVIVNAAGNDSHSSIGHLESKYMSWNNLIGEKDYPDVYSRIIVVGAVNKQFDISEYSNEGKRTDIFAPGDDIYSTISNNRYDFKSGTSMAAPHVAGVAAMVWSANNSLTGKDVKDIICESTNSRCTSCKMIDAHIAVEKAFNQNNNSTPATPDSVIAMSFVVDSTNNDVTLSNVDITFTNQSTSEKYPTKTDNHGHFEVALPKGEYSVTAKLNGYIDYNGQFSITSDGVNYIDKIRMVNWKKLYIDMINSDTSNYANTYDLVLVNNDDIPELLLFTGSHFPGTSIAWIANNKVETQSIGYSKFLYYKKNNRFYCTNYYEPVHIDSVYELSDNNSLSELFAGTITKNVPNISEPGWFINGISVSENEYNDSLDSIFDKNIADKSENSYNKEEIIDVINRY